VFWVNASIYGTILGGYAVFASDFHSFSPAVFATILFSPSRGLFPIQPVSALSPVPGDRQPHEAGTVVPESAFHRRHRVGCHRSLLWFMVGRI
jgi:hypothetical protein